MVFIYQILRIMAQTHVIDTDVHSSVLNDLMAGGSNKHVFLALCLENEQLLIYENVFLAAW